MPKSINRRQIEIPTHLYDELAAEAKAAGVPVTKILTDLVEDGRTLHEWITGIDAQLHTLVHDVYALRKMLEDDRSKGEGVDTVQR